MSVLSTQEHKETHLSQMLESTEKPEELLKKVRSYKGKTEVLWERNVN